MWLGFSLPGCGSGLLMWALLVQIRMPSKEIVPHEAAHEGIELPLKGPQGDFLSFLLADKGVTNNLVYWFSAKHFFSGTIGGHFGKFGGDRARAQGQNVNAFVFQLGSKG